MTSPIIALPFIAALVLFTTALIFLLLEIRLLEIRLSVGDIARLQQAFGRARERGDRRP